MKKLITILILCANIAMAAPTPITLIVPFSAGGAPDSAARFIQPVLSKELGRDIVIEYKLGVGGELGHAQIANANPNTLVLGMTTPAIVFNTVNRKATFDLNDVVPLGYFALPNVIATSNKSTLRTVDDLFASEKDPIFYGTNGVGSLSHIMVEKIRSISKKNYVAVPYKGVPPILQDMIANNVDLSVMFYSVAKPFVDTQQIQVLAVDTKKRLPNWPNVPTFRESKIKELSGKSSYVILVSNRYKDTADLDRVRKALIKIINDKEIANQFKEAGFVLDHEDPIPRGDFLMQQQQILTKFVKDIDLERDSK